MWSSGPAPHGHSSGNGWREHVITRQPALEKRITVAWPIPRLAPVRSSVRRGPLLVAFGIAVLQTFKFTDKVASWTMADLAPRGGIRCGRAAGRGGRARIRNVRARRA